MKIKLIGIFLTLLFFSGCAEKTVILVPQTEYYPTFPTSDFKEAKGFKIHPWTETEEVNGSLKTYLVIDYDEAMKCIEHNKQLRSDYNLLRSKLIKFNEEIKEMNRIQNEKKPQEVKSSFSLF
jgi:hypothetical protein